MWAAKTLGREDLQFVQVFDRGQTGSLDELLGFGSVLGQVDQQRNVQLIGQVVCSDQMLARHRVRGVGRYGGRHPGMVAPALDELASVAVRLVPGLVVGCRKVDESLTDDRSHTATVRFLGDDILEVVHVDKGGDASTQHLETGQSRSPANEFLVHELGLDGKDVILEPVHELQIVGDASQKGHGDVGMGVDQTGEDDAATGIDTAGVGVGFEQLRLWPQLGDGVAHDQHSAFFDEGVVLVEGDDGAVVDDQLPDIVRVAVADHGRGWLWLRLTADSPNQTDQCQDICS